VHEGCIGQPSTEQAEPVALSSSLTDFIRSAFPSVWTLELLLLLRTEPERRWTGRELVDKLRASEPIIVQGVATLLAGGLAATDAGSSIRYAPASPEMARLVEEAARQYAKRPDAVRRIIVFADQTGLQAFSDAGCEGPE
jgi:hypothetical protein